MPLESASYISQLQPSNPASTDLVGQADDHIRLLKTVLKSTFPKVDGPINLSTSQLNSTSPIGLIALWYGSSASVPSGWAICNGQTVTKTDGTGGTITTPNLVDKVPIGAGTIAAQGAAAGSATATATSANAGAHTHVIGGGSHGHTGTAEGTALTVSQIPAHNHGIGVTSSTVDGSGGYTFQHMSAAGTQSTSYIGNRGDGQPHSHVVTVDTSASHAHTVDTVAAHNHSVTVSTIQPVLGLHYIMRV